jgi:hypothetical protein
MGLFDTVTVEVLSADFQTKQLGEGMLRYHLAADGRLVAPCGVVVAYHGIIHLVGEDGAEFMGSSLTDGWNRSTRSPSKAPMPSAAWAKVCSGRGIAGDLTAHPPTVRACQRAGPAAGNPPPSKGQPGPVDIHLPRGSPQNVRQVGRAVLPALPRGPDLVTFTYDAVRLRCGRSLIRDGGT